MLTPKQSIAQLYVAYFNRAPEPLGFDFWCSVLDNPVTLTDIATDFATQEEARLMYPLLEDRGSDSVSNFLTQIYQNLFDRDPEGEGLAFWIGVIQGGADLGTILLEIMNGASEADRLVMDGKAIVAEYWVEAARDAVGYSLTDQAIDVSREAIEAVNPPVALPLPEVNDTDEMPVLPTVEDGRDITDLYFQTPGVAELTPSFTSMSPGATFISRQKVADITVVDDGLGQNVLGLQGTDADLFELDGAALFLKQNALLQIGSDERFDVTVTVDDAGRGHYLTDGPETGTGFAVLLEEIEIEGGFGEINLTAEDEFQLNTLEQGDQFRPDVAALGNGLFVAAWTTNRDVNDTFIREDIKLRIFEKDGSEVVAEFHANAAPNNVQSAPRVIPLEDGNFVVAWQDFAVNGSTNNDVKARIFDSDGDAVSAEFDIATNLGAAQREPDLAPLADGGFVAVFESNGPSADGFGTGILARSFDENGDEVLAEFTVNNETDGGQTDAVVAALPGGGFAVAWETNEPIVNAIVPFNLVNANIPGEIKARIFAENGDPVDVEFMVNQDTFSAQRDPAITALSNGNIVITWQSADLSGDDNIESALKGRIFDPEGDPVTDELLLNGLIEGGQSLPDITALSNGGFAVVWESTDQLQEMPAQGSAVKMQIFNEKGDAVLDQEVLVNQGFSGFQSDMEITQLDSGELIVAWESGPNPTTSDNNGLHVVARVFDLNEDGGVTTTEELLVPLLNDAEDFAYNPAELVGQPMPVEPDGGIA